MKLTGNSIQFDESACTFDSNQSGTLVWMTPEGDILGASASNAPPDIAANINDQAALRAHYQQLAAQSDLGFVETDWVLLADSAAVWVVFTKREGPVGMTYMGSYIFPFRDGCVIFKLQCREKGSTETLASNTNHPLTRLRRQRETLMDTVALQPRVKDLPPYVYPPEITVVAPKRPWWKVGR